MKQLNKDFYSCIHRSLLGADIQFIHYKFAAEDDNNNEVVELGNISVTRDVFRELLPAKPFSDQFMLVVTQLFKIRTDHIRTIHKDVHENPPDPKPPVDTSLFYVNILEAENDIRISFNDQVANVFLICQDNQSRWILFIVDVRAKIIYNINPTFVNNPYDEETAAFMENVEARVSELMRVLKPDVNFNGMVYPHQYYQPNEDNFSSGLIIFLSIYHVEMKCPIHFRRCDLEKMRYNLAYWIMICQLPY